MNDDEGLPHQPVLYHEIITALRPHRKGRYVDATVGAGGHAWGILNASSPDGCLLGMDVDPHALALAGRRLDEFGKRAYLVRASYTSLLDQLTGIGWSTVDGILADLGLSSMQLDNPARGFSFQAEGPLDMRFDPQQNLTAANVVNEWSEEEIAGLLWKFGEERNARRIARRICQARPMQTTTQLAQVVAGAAGGKWGRIHPATRTFQALRMAVNVELQNIGVFLPQAMQALAPGGRLAIISFHSLEDRLVKQYLRRESRDCICPPGQPVCTCNHKAILKEVGHKPVQAADVEVDGNPRARSARLRVAERLSSGTTVA